MKRLIPLVFCLTVLAVPAQAVAAPHMTSWEAHHYAKRFIRGLVRDSSVARTGHVTGCGRNSRSSFICGMAVTVYGGGACTWDEAFWWNSRGYLRAREVGQTNCY